MPRNLQHTFRVVTLMGIFIAFSFWWFSGNTIDERLDNLWMLVIFIPVFVLCYFALRSRISRIPTEE
jgi:hypothetical protein